MTRTDRDEQFLKTVQKLLGWTLAPELEVEALALHARGQSAAAIADAFERRETARNALNDPDAPLFDPPTRADDDDPRNFSRR